MFLNPMDHGTISAMTIYHQEQINDAWQASLPEQRPIIVVRRSPEPGVIGSLRQSVGLMMIRAGARLAGIGLQTRIGTQS